VNQTVWYQVRQNDRMSDMWGTGYRRNPQGDFIVGSNGRYIAGSTLKKLGNYSPDFMGGPVEPVQRGQFQSRLSARLAADWCRARWPGRRGGSVIEQPTGPMPGIVAQA
jgi:hypothetical protein